MRALRDHLRRRAVDLDEQYRLRVEWEAGVQHGLDCSDGGLVDHFERGGNDA